MPDLAWLVRSGLHEAWLQNVMGRSIPPLPFQNSGSGRIQWERSAQYMCCTPAQFAGSNRSAMLDGLSTA